jgi:hypothetical protein
MKDRHTIRDFSFGELVQVAEALNRSEAALQERYKHLAGQTRELLSRRGQEQRISRKNQP